MNDRLYKLYSQWDNEKLLKEQSLPENYNEEAILVMKQLVNERGLEKEVQTIAAIQQAKEEQQFQALTEEYNARGRNYEYVVLGTNEPSDTYAKKQKNASGIFYETIIGKKSGNMIFSVLFLVLGLCGVIIGGLFFFVTRYDHSPGLYIVAAGVLAFIAGINYYKKGRTVLRLIERGKSLYLEIEERGGKAYKIKYPFQYYHYCGSQTYSVNHIPVNTNAILYITIYCPQEKLNINIEETLPSLIQGAPPDWPKAANIPFAKESVDYSPYGMTKSNLYKLKKILDGLAELYPE